MYEEIDAYILRLIRESTPERTLWNVEKLRKNRPSDWNYIDGCMIAALLAIADITKDARYFVFSQKFIDHFVREDGSILTFKPETNNLDDIREGCVLFELYEKTGREKYRRAAEFLHERLMRHPRTCEGSFWHKDIYPNQVWLDGLYMAQVFNARFERDFGAGNYRDITDQIEIVRRHMYDPEKKLYYHGYDASGKAFWADPITGCSRSFWLRSIGWFASALIDILEILPVCDAKARVKEIFLELMDGVSRYADAETGMFYQVVDQEGRKGNYLETSGSAMIAYAMLKGARLGFLDRKYAAHGRMTFDGIVDRYLFFDKGEMNLNGICLVAGLGPEDNLRRDGSYEYYISEPVVQNDAKGVAPFILCFSEIKRLNSRA